MLNWLKRNPPGKASAMLPGRARHMRPATSVRRRRMAWAESRISRPVMPRRHAGTHDGADGRACDRHRPDTEIVQRLDDVDMGEAACPASTECYGEARLAGSHPFSASATGGPTTSTDGSAVSSARHRLDLLERHSVDQRRAPPCSRCRDRPSAAQPACWRSSRTNSER